MDSTNQQQSTSPQAPMGNMASQGGIGGQKEEGRGATIGTIIIIVLLIIAGAYVWMTRTQLSVGPDETILNQPDASLDALNQQSSSDDINAIEQDITATDLNNLDSDLNNASAELNAIQ